MVPHGVPATMPGASTHLKTSRVAVLMNGTFTLRVSHPCVPCCALARNRAQRQHSIAPCRYTSSQSYSYKQHVNSLEPLQQLLGTQQYEDMLIKHPELMTCQLRSPVTSWLDFFEAYGLDQHLVSKLLLHCSDFLACSSIYEAGRTLLFFRHLGWRNEQIKDRIFAQYPQVLAKQIERDILPIIQELMKLGCTPNDIKLLVWEYPRIFTAGRDYKRHIRKFQYLGLYGLKLPQHSGSSSTNGSSGSESDAGDVNVKGSMTNLGRSGYRQKTDSLEWLMMMVQN